MDTPWPPEVAALRALSEMIAANARSARQRERVVSAARLPLTAAGLTALRIIERHGPLPASDLARRLGIDLSTISRQLRPLDDHALIERTVDGTDRRVTWLTVTDAGRDALSRADAVAANDFAVALGDWNPADRAELGRLLERLLVSLRSVRTDETGWSVGTAPVEPVADPTHGSGRRSTPSSGT